MLAVETLAKPQPRAAICSCAVGPGGGAGGPPARPAPPPRAGAAPRPGPAAAGDCPGSRHGVVAGMSSGAAPPLPNISTTGTGTVASFGVLTVARIVTCSDGYV